MSTILGYGGQKVAASTGMWQTDTWEALFSFLTNAYKLRINAAEMNKMGLSISSSATEGVLDRQADAEIFAGASSIAQGAISGGVSAYSSFQQNKATTELKDCEKITENLHIAQAEVKQNQSNANIVRPAAETPAMKQADTVTNDKIKELGTNDQALATFKKEAVKFEQSGSATPDTNRKLLERLDELLTAAKAKMEKAHDNVNIANNKQNALNSVVQYSGNAISNFGSAGMKELQKLQEVEKLTGNNMLEVGKMIHEMTTQEISGLIQLMQMLMQTQSAVAMCNAQKG